MSTSNGHLSPEYNTVPTRYGDAVLLDDSRYEKELQLQGVEFMGKVALEKGSPFNKEVQIIECGVLSDMKWPGPVSAKKIS